MVRLSEMVHGVIQSKAGKVLAGGAVAALAVPILAGCSQGGGAAVRSGDVNPTAFPNQTIRDAYTKDLQGCEGKDYTFTVAKETGKVTWGGVDLTTQAQGLAATLNVASADEGNGVGGDTGSGTGAKEMDCVQQKANYELGVAKQTDTNGWTSQQKDDLGTTENSLKKSAELATQNRDADNAKAASDRAQAWGTVKQAVDAGNPDAKAQLAAIQGYEQVRLQVNNAGSALNIEQNDWQSTWNQINYAKDLPATVIDCGSGSTYSYYYDHCGYYATDANGNQVWVNTPNYKDPNPDKKAAWKQVDADMMADQNDVTMSSNAIAAANAALATKGLAPIQDAQGQAWSNDQLAYILAMVGSDWSGNWNDLDAFDFGAADQMISATQVTQGSVATAGAEISTAEQPFKDQLGVDHQQAMTAVANAINPTPVIGDTSSKVS